MREDRSFGSLDICSIYPSFGRIVIKACNIGIFSLDTFIAVHNRHHKTIK